MNWIDPINLTALVAQMAWPICSCVVACKALGVLTKYIETKRQLAMLRMDDQIVKEGAKAGPGVQDY